jgi:hypothetical protein
MLALISVFDRKAAARRMFERSSDIVGSASGYWTYTQSKVVQAGITVVQP